MTRSCVASARHNCPPIRPWLIDDGTDLTGGNIRSEVLSASDQHAWQGEAFSAAVRGGQALEYGLDDAIANMRVIDALFRSRHSGHWEKP